VPFSPAQHDPHDHRTGQRLPARPVRAAPAVPLDELVPLGDPVHLLAVDVNGAESAVLHGARRLLERARPRIVARFSAVRLRQAGEDPVLVLAAWRGFGYDVRVLDEDGHHDDAAIVALCDARAQPGGGWVVLGLRPA
jgi:hypothetical protein